MSFPFKYCQIDDVVLNVTTWNPARDGHDQLIRYIDLSSVDQDTKVIRPNKPIVAREAPSRARQLVQTGDVLVSTVRPNLNGVAMVDGSLDGATASTGFCVLRPDGKKLDRSYLFHWVKTPEFISDMVRKATGASYPAVSDRIVLESRISLPTIAEQKRIAAILDKAEELRGLRRRALRELDTIVQSIFLEMFGDPVTNQKGNKVVRLSDITTRITDGVHQKPNYTERGVPFISVKDITTGRLKFDDCKFISREEHEKFTKRCRPELHDILYTKVGATYGRPALIDIDKEFSIYVSVCLIKPKRDLIDPLFLCTALGTSAVKNQADRKIKGIGVPDLHLDQIQSFLIPLPSMDEQQEFTRRIQEIEQLKATHRESLAQLDALFASLQHRAFRGEL